MYYIAMDESDTMCWDEIRMEKMDAKWNVEQSYTHLFVTFIVYLMTACEQNKF